jgi:hypothetical protein
MSNDFEREYDDDVYEDEFYEEHYDEEELTDDEELVEGGHKEFDDEEDEKYEKDEKDPDGAADDEVTDEGDADDWEKKNSVKVEVSYACEDCDYRWEDVIIKRKDVLEDEEVGEIEVACPMCGSVTITQI